MRSTGTTRYDDVMSGDGDGGAVGSKRKNDHVKRVKRLDPGLEPTRHTEHWISASFQHSITVTL
jgi:hypothetical protein